MSTAQQQPEFTREARANLDSIFRPRSVVLVGATERQGSVGRALLTNLSSFPGTLHLVHPTRKSVLGHPAAPSLDALEAPVDLAVLATPAASIPKLIAEAGAQRVRSAVVISAGFTESGPPGVALAKQVVEAAARHGIRVLGPNCLGVIAPHAFLNASFAATSARPGKVAFLSQSGALCTAMLDWSQRKNVGFSAFVSVGSMLDIGWADLIRFFGDDPHTESIVLYMESVGRGADFMDAARDVSLRKPIIAIKVGRTLQASRAAASHTGSMTGSDAVLDAAFEQSGVIRVDTIEQLFGIAEVLSKQRLPRGPRLAILTNAGGPAALATDALVRSGGVLAEFTPGTAAALDRFLPAHWSRSNPADILGDADASRYERSIQSVLADPDTDGALVILTPQSMTQCEATAEAVARSAQTSQKPLYTSWMGGSKTEAGRSILDACGIPSFSYPDEAARVWQYLQEYPARRKSALEMNRALLRQRLETSRARDLVEHFLIQGRSTLNEPESKQLLRLAGIPVSETLTAASETEAVATARQIGFPVVIKLLSNTITHKSDVHGVRLNLANVEAVQDAWRDIANSVPSADFGGVSVQSMFVHSGVELICGCVRDSQFGPVLLFGAGGILAELFGDRVLLLPPLSRELVLERIQRTRVFALLRGARHMAPAHIESVADALVSLGDLALAVPEIAEMDINPLVATSSGSIALDGRVILSRDHRTA